MVESSSPPANKSGLPPRPSPADRLLEALAVDPRACDPAIAAALRALAEEVLFLRGREARLARELGRAEMLADRDALCPVFNRRAFVRELSREMALSRRHGAALCLVYIDLDRFKLINDRFGHTAGDKALKSVCALIEGNVRESDIVGRLGGDEFGLILSHADKQDADQKMASLAGMIADLVIAPQEGETGEPLSLGASFGVVQWDGHMGPDALIAAADEAMFRAKPARKFGAR
ncbi:MAG: GGDEF domain-containing protein [Henriciella sp.]|jgi:diguanylate cyclase (GGDEF)-like protein|uniref:GGDEF domain-containing protein n=1 Tax=Henriciella sp. TaxID=1968823 RepID=UPI000C0CE205|nr:GGDEF domain-containing protein [Henriciella sp.]MAN73266.1 GGDEF domain-containing protein [Henriciella sp.]MBF33349.1 GGDEF domain-containing protein [Hyphomonadaceae bacterium]MBK74815.1 GGDEF domain-containing protein [Henriciella sp.]PHR79049.1 MAG: GGDEF domain-containing protein [Henriciella sp.]|tara:strand:+ start:471 stop:1172 length:702 start_codon:yes stop_codon:yes gene_type:complete